ncbi:MAG: DUF4440 domain-containing protein [Gemmatimonadetes bacterium]|nr:DUF4440 domain-containing protein [Gemmatimonadota bacterium]
MKQLRFLLLFALVGAACSPSSKAANAAAEFTADDESAIRGVVGQFERAWLANDYASVVALMVPDHVETLPVAGVGREAALERYQGFGVSFTSGTYDVKRLEGSGDLAYAWVEFNGRYTTDSGVGGMESGNNLWVFRKGPDGKWAIAASSYQGVSKPDSTTS